LIYHIQRDQEGTLPDQKKSEMKFHQQQLSFQMIEIDF
jgi:hypothetical protein